MHLYFRSTEDVTCSMHSQGGETPGSDVSFTCVVSVFGAETPSMEWIRRDQVMAENEFV